VIDAKKTEFSVTISLFFGTLRRKKLKHENIKTMNWKKNPIWFGSCSWQTCLPDN